MNNQKTMLAIVAIVAVIGLIGAVAVQSILLSQQASARPTGLQKVHFMDADKDQRPLNKLTISVYTETSVNS